MGHINELSFFYIYWVLEGIAFLIAGIYCMILLILNGDIIFNPDIGQNIKFIMFTNLIVMFIRVLVLIPFYIFVKPMDDSNDNDEKLTKSVIFYTILLILTNISLGITLYYTSDTYKNKLVVILIEKGSMETQQVLKNKLDKQIKPIKTFSIISLILVNLLATIIFILYLSTFIMDAFGW